MNFYTGCAEAGLGFGVKAKNKGDNPIGSTVRSQQSPGLKRWRLDASTPELSDSSGRARRQNYHLRLHL